jgi:hypothetical protein
MEDIALANSWLRDANGFRRAVISGKRKGLQPEFLRVDIRPVLIKRQLHLQTVSHDGRKDITKNFLPDEIDITRYVDAGYANIRIETTDEIFEIHINEEKNLKIRRSNNNQAAEIQSLEHDRRKERRIPITDPIFLHLGIADKDGELIPRQSDKFKQVDEFLKLIENLIPDIVDEKKVSIVDLGCGNAYLTFATYRFLELNWISAKVVGVDTRKESIDRNK